MFIFLSKFLPPFVYPLGLAILLILAALLFYKRLRWQRLVLLLALLLLLLGSNRWVSYSLARSLEWQYLPSASLPVTDVIVLLGGGTEPGDYPRPAPGLNGAGDRILYAASLYKQGKAAHILVTGGNIDWLGSESIPQANDMAAILETMGVPAQAIWLEGASRNTYENALNSRKILIDDKHIRRILLVTSALHMPRSVSLFRKQGFDVIPAPTDFMVTQAGWDELTSLNIPGQLVNLAPSADNLSAVDRALKEYLGILVYKWRGWI